MPSFPALVSRARNPKVAGREIKLFVIERIVGDVHFAVEATQRSVVVEDSRRVVIDAGSTFFKERGNKNDSIAACGGCKLFRTRAGNRLGEIEERVIFALAKILRLKKFRQTDDLRAASGSVGNAAQGLLEILFGLWSARHLHQGHAKLFRRHALRSSAFNIAGESFQLSALSFQQPSWFL